MVLVVCYLLWRWSRRRHESLGHASRFNSYSPSRQAVSTGSLGSDICFNSPRNGSLCKGDLSFSENLPVKKLNSFSGEVGTAVPA